ncbi:MAG: Recombination protein RecR [Verrucomicrobia subdivision 3 bacterium]|nr:Recombination protein RecR [Limisphaerales bacterium]MCS1414512.1 Recombination protein RecR [Limisphaerales bacterium]
MAELPVPLQVLKSALGKLPGIGPRTAERLALHVVQSGSQWVKDLSVALVEAKERVRFCQSCGGLTEVQPCELCADPRREMTVICVVERPVDVISLERSNVFRGLYHVLGGKISPLNGVGPEDLRIGELGKRLSEGGVEELVLALGSDVEGDATSYYLAERFQPLGIKTTRLAHGLPVGRGLEFADELTIGRALEGRRALDLGPSE